MTRHSFVALALATLLFGAMPAATHASDESERTLAREFALHARSRLPLLTDVEVVGYVERLGNRIIATLDGNPFTYQFVVVRDPKINAFAVPGGFIGVHSGLLTRARTDDEVAGVLAHEIAHIHAHHLARQQEATRFMNYAAMLGLVLSAIQPAIGAAAVGASAAAQLKYAREFEQEADYLGAGYAARAGFDPHGMMTFFEKMAEEQRQSPSNVPPYLQSHPLTDERLTNLTAVLRGQPARSPGNPATLARVQVLVRTKTELPNDVLIAYRRAVDDHPSDPHARYLLGVAFLETGKLDAARQTLQQARDLGWADAANRELGRTWLRLRDVPQARRLLARAVEIDPGDAIAHAELAKALETAGETDSALREYERALALAPALDGAHYDYGVLAGRMGREADGYFHLAESYRLRGEYAKALRQYERVAPLLPPANPRAEYVRDQIAMLQAFLRHARGR
jgi:predicted Zn-dependent protease